ncbi:MAG: hypothetical protein AABY00_03310 [Nanoarchaeota archaeon]
MDPIKEAFQRAKQDIAQLQEQITFLTQETSFLRQTLDDLLYFQQLQHIQQTDRPTDIHNTSQIPLIPAQKPQTPAQNEEIPALQQTEYNTPAQNMPLEASKDQFSNVSSGNRGVPADRQTDRQTDQHIQNQEEIHSQAHQTSSFKHISQAIDTLDQAKKDLRLQFKRLTEQEMQVFAAIFSLEDQGFIVDYPLLAQKCSLTESSIRDYIQKLLKKGSPIIKIKENNKKILLKIDPELKKMTSLTTIYQLRDI